MLYGYCWFFKCVQNLKAGDVMEQICWGLCRLGSVIGLLTLAATFITANGAPQEASGAALAIAFAVIPYCLARTFSQNR